MKCLCHVSDMFRERKWKSFKFLRRLISEYDSVAKLDIKKNHHLEHAANKLAVISIVLQ